MRPRSTVTEAGRAGCPTTGAGNGPEAVAGLVRGLQHLG
jgi:hypothetical protein